MSYRSDLSETHPTTSSPRQFDKFWVCVISPVSMFLVRLPGLYREQPLPCRVKYITDTTGGAQVSPKRVITHQTIHRTSPRSRNYLLVWTLLPRFYQAGSILFLLTSTSMTSLPLRGLPRLSLSFPDRCWFIGIPWRKKSQLCKIQLSISFINLADNCPQEHLNTWQLYTIECTLL